MPIEGCKARSLPILKRLEENHITEEFDAMCHCIGVFSDAVASSS